MMLEGRIIGVSIWMWNREPWLSRLGDRGARLSRSLGLDPPRHYASLLYDGENLTLSRAGINYCWPIFTMRLVRTISKTRTARCLQLETLRSPFTR